MHTIVSKFGGTSVSSKQTWDNIVHIARTHIENGLKPILVCSARSKASNTLEQLIALARQNSYKELLNEFTQLHHDLCDELELSREILIDDFV